MIPRHLFCCRIARSKEYPSCSNVGTLHATCDRDLAKAAQKGDELAKRHRDFKAAKLLALGPRPGKPRANTFLNQRFSSANMPSISIGTSPCRLASIEALLMEEQIDAERLQVRREANEVLQARPRCYLKETPRVTNPPWKLEAWGMAHVSLETTAALPDSTVTPPDENVTRVGPLSVTNRCRP